MKKPDLRCWHICYLQKNQEMLETLEVSTVLQLHDLHKDSEEIEYVF